MDAAELRRGIGYVIQHAGLFPHRTVVDNIATVPLLLGWDKKKARAARRWSCSSGSGCRPSFAERYPAQLSGGQQQRVGVARALAADPPVMLMDEPFSAVDPIVREQLQDEFLRLQGELGKTIVFVTHDIDEAIKLGDQVAVLRVGGTLAQLAAPAELLAHPADDFVAGFVGRDRGYRALGFQSTPALPIRTTSRPSRSVPPPDAGAPGRRRRLGAGRRRRPGRWAGSSRPGLDRRPAAPGRLHRGGTVATPRRLAARAARRRAVLAEPAAASSSTTTAGCSAPCAPHEVLTAIEEGDRPAVHAEDLQPVEPPS